MSREKQIGHEIHCLSKQLRRYVDHSLKMEGVDQVTAMHGWVLGWLYDHRDQELYQKDLENWFHIARSSVTSIVQYMEGKGYIRREGVARDARLKKLVLTPEGEKIHLKSIEVFDRIEENLKNTFSPEELERFFSMTQRLGRTIDDALEEDDRKNEKGGRRLC